jgi:hypothetical protein
MTVPANIRFNLNAPFPSLVTGTGPITVNKMNGIWQIGYTVANLAKQNVLPAAGLTTQYVTAWDSQAQGYFNVPLSAVATPTLLNTMVAAGSPTLQDSTSLPLGYNEYSFVFENIVPVTATGVSFEMQVQLTGGAFQTTGYINSAGTLITCVDILQAATLGTGGFSGTVTMFGKPSANTIKQVRGFGAFVNITPGASAANCVGWYNTAAPLNAVRFQMSAGNISSGTIKVYGTL